MLIEFRGGLPRLNHTEAGIKTRHFVGRFIDRTVKPKAQQAAQRLVADITTIRNKAQLMIDSASDFSMPEDLIIPIPSTFGIPNTVEPNQPQKKSEPERMSRLEYLNRINGAIPMGPAKNEPAITISTDFWQRFGNLGIEGIVSGIDTIIRIEEALDQRNLTPFMKKMMTEELVVGIFKRTLFANSEGSVNPIDEAKDYYTRLQYLNNSAPSAWRKLTENINPLHEARKYIPQAA